MIKKRATIVYRIWFWYVDAGYGEDFAVYGVSTSRSDYRTSKPLEYFSPTTTKEKKGSRPWTNLFTVKT